MLTTRVLPPATTPIAAKPLAAIPPAPRRQKRAFPRACLGGDCSGIRRHLPHAHIAHDAASRNGSSAARSARTGVGCQLPSATCCRAPTATPPAATPLAALPLAEILPAPRRQNVSASLLLNSHVCITVAQIYRICSAIAVIPDNAGRSHAAARQRSGRGQDDRRRVLAVRA